MRSPRGDARSQARAARGSALRGFPLAHSVRRSPRPLPTGRWRRAEGTKALGLGERASAHARCRCPRLPRTETTSCSRWPSPPQSRRLRLQLPSHLLQPWIGIYWCFSGATPSSFLELQSLGHGSVSVALSLCAEAAWPYSCRTRCGGQGACGCGGRAARTLPRCQRGSAARCSAQTVAFHSSSE